MTKTAVLLLAISAGVDFLMAFSAALTASILASEWGGLPNWSSLVVAALGGSTAAARSIQPVLKQLLVEHGLKMNGEVSAVVKAASKVT